MTDPNLTRPCTPSRSYINQQYLINTGHEGTHFNSLHAKEGKHMAQVAPDTTDVGMFHDMGH